MPTIGGVFVPDALLPRLEPAARERPSLGRVLGAAAEGAYGQVRYGIPYQAAKLSGNITPEDEAFYRRGLAESSAAASRAAPASVGDVTSGRVGVGRFIGENLAASLPYMAGAVAGGVGGALVGGPAGAAVGAVAGGVPQFSGSNVARAVETEGGLSEAAAERALAIAPLQSAADAAIARFLPGAGKVLGDLAATQSGGFLRRTATSMLEAAGTEAVTEAAQQVGERYAAGLPVTDADAVGEYVNAAVTAFALGGVLGSGGGFRRTNALAKPADMVTNEDMISHIDGVLSGSSRAGQLALPAPADINVGPDGVARVNPSGSVQLALPSPERFQGPDFIADAEGRIVPPGMEGERALVMDRNAPRQSAPPPPTIDEIMARARAGLPDLGVLAAPQPAAAPPASATSTAALTGTPVANPQPELPVASRRLFASEPISDINTALSAKDAAPELRAEAERELGYRYAEAAGTEPLSAPDFQTRLNDVKTGLRGGWVQGLQATDPADLVGKVYTRIFEDADTSVNVTRLAQRLGILDGNLEPTAVADRIEAERLAVLQAAAQPQSGGTSETAPAAPVTREGGVSPESETAQSASSSMTPQVVDANFEQEWQRLKNDAGIARLRGGQSLLASTPPNLQAARAQVFRALAEDTSNAEVSQVEKLARKMGLVTDDDAMDVTPLGRQTFLTTPEGFEETVSAARQQGYVGAQASVFERGVRAQLSGDPPAATGSFEDMTAYQAGRVWAQDFVDNATTRTAAQTEAIRARQDTRQTGTAADRAEISRRELSPQQVQQQSLNRLLDAVDTSNVVDTDMAALRRLIRDGVSPRALGQAIERVQGGQTLFSQPPRSPGAYAGVRVERGQPIFRELYDPTKDTPAKVRQRLESEAAVQAYGARNLIDFAQREGGITAARAAKLHDLLDQGKVSQVRNLLKAFDPDAQPRRRLPTPPERVDTLTPGGRSVGPADPAFEQAITGKSFAEVVDHMIEQAPSRYSREIMRRVKDLMGRLEKAGTTFEFNLLRPGDEGPMILNRPTTPAAAVIGYNPPSARVYLKGAEFGGDSGANYQMAAHEMIHAVTVALLRHGAQDNVVGKGHIGKAVKDLTDLGDTIRQHLEQRRIDGKLSPFEERILRGQNSLDNNYELVAWGLTNPVMQKYLQSIEYKPRQSVFGRLVELLRNLLGLGGSYDTALTELLRVSEQVFKTPDAELQAVFARNNPDAMETAPITAEAREAADTSAANRTVQASNGVTQEFAQAASGLVDRINPRDFAVKSRRTVLGWLSHNQLNRQYGREIPSLIEHSDAHGARVALRSRFEQMGEGAYQNFERLEQANPKMAERVGQLMATATEFQLDPNKSWEEHTWLKDEPNAQRLKALHGEVVKLANDLKRGDGAGWQVYNEFQKLNEAQNFARMAVSLHGLVATDPELSLGVENSWVNPADQFMQQAQGVSTPDAIRDYWARTLDQQVANAMAFVTRKKGEAAQGTASDQRAMREHLSPVEAQIGAISQARAAMDRAPYFHLGRFGDNFGSAVIRKGEDGRVDPVAQRKVADALEKAGFTDAQISADNTKPRFMLRFDTVDQALRFRDLALQLQRQGLLSADDDIKVGPRNRADNFGTADGLPAFVASYIQNLEASPMFAADENMDPAERASLDKLKQDTIQLARDTWIESQPDSSISKVLTQRNTIAGYNKDMIRNWAHRWRVGSINIANVASAPKLNRAYTNMKAQYNDALVANRRGANGEMLAPSDPFTVQDVMSELKMRDARNPVNETADAFDKARGFAHSYFLGFSPAYGMINLTQLGVTALPELAKRGGYSKAFHAMRRATGPALAIMNAVRKEAGKLGWKHWGDVAITDSVLKNAGLDENTRNFVTQMLATGTIDIGSMARALGQVADNKGVGGGVETYLRLSSAMGLYTETFSRLVTALAARDLHGGFGPEAQKYAAKTVSESMFDYQNWNTARQLGKKGFLGPITPLLTQFMSYTAQVTEKLYSEAMDAFGKARPGESPEAVQQRKAEARRFLMGHLTAVTTLAGTLGLPFATAFATAIERLVDAVDDDDEPFDATAAWRNFLASVFGKDVAEVVARGAPRALGFDISARAGEQNLLPFSEFFADRRSWKEAVSSNAGRSIGAVPSMILNILDGGGQIADGDLLGGMKTMLPVAFKGPTEAYRLTTEGYVDTKGNRLPMSPGASDALWQLMGFTPSARAEYSEARGDQAARRGVLTRQAGQLRNGIVRALANGDRDTARDLIAEAIEFDQNNPAFAVIPSLAASVKRQQQSQAQARTLNSPVGVSMRDIAGQQLSQYANF